MLRTRIITALILAPSVLAAVLFLPLAYLAVVLWVIAAAGGYEWAGLGGLQHVAQRLLYVGAFGLLAALLFQQQTYFAVVLMLGCAVWVFAALAVLMFPRGTALFRNHWFVRVLGLMVLLSAWAAMLVIRDTANGSYWLIWVFMLAWAADIGAYFAGHAFGQRKLAPHVSPGKTWEGAVGGLALALLVCALGAYWLTPQWMAWLPIIAFLVAVSVFGDLFESVLKRATGVKDSGTLLPGHGGVLDRIDSLLAVLPVFALILTAMSQTS